MDKKIKVAGFYKKSILFTTLSAVAAIFNYALYPTLVRVIGPTSFGDFATVLALSNQLLVILTCVNIVLIYVNKRYGSEKASEYANIIQRTALIGYSLIGLLLAISSPLIKSALSIESGYSFVALLATIVLAVPALIWTGQLHGEKELVRIAAYTLVSSFARLVISVVLASKWGTNGATSGIVLGLVVGLIVLWAYPGKRLKNPLDAFKANKKHNVEFLSIRKLFWASAISVAALGFLQNIDILLAKYLFNPTDAGLYSSLSVLSNAIYFGSFLLVWIVLPEFSLVDKVVNRRLLRTSYLIMSSLYVAFLAVGFLFYDNLLKQLLGIEIDYPTLALACTYQYILVSCSLYIYYQLSRHNLRTSILTVLSVIIIAGTALWLKPHDTRSLISHITISLVCSIMLFLIYSTLSVRNQRSKIV